MVFEDIIDATKFWVKGDQFTVDRVLGPRADLAPRFLLHLSTLLLTMLVL